MAYSRFKRVVGSLLAASQLIFVLQPTLVAAAETVRDTSVSASGEGAVKRVSSKRSQPVRKVNRTVPKVVPSDPARPLPDSPTTLDLRTRLIFSEVLQPIGAEPTREENEALGGALNEFIKSRTTEKLEEFLRLHPRSPWSLSLRSQLAGINFRKGYFSVAIDAWKSIWEDTQGMTSREAAVIADNAAAEYARLNARIGRMDVLESFFNATKDRKFQGRAAQLISDAKDGLWQMNREPEDSFLCGPLALSSIWSEEYPGSTLPDVLTKATSTKEGFSLAGLAKLAQDAHLDYVPAFREANTPIPLPSLINWKVGHYAAVIEHKDGQYHIIDPTFGSDMWVESGAVDTEGSGYFMVPTASIGRGWREVPAAEASIVWGKGNNGEAAEAAPNDPGNLEKPPCNCDGGGTGTPGGMPAYSFHPVWAMLELHDTPLSYSTPIGPQISFTAHYQERNWETRSTSSFPNLGENWTHNWLMYVEVQGTGGTTSAPPSATLYSSGRLMRFSNPSGNVYQRNYRSPAKLKWVSEDTYRMESPDGSYLTFSHATSLDTKRVFLTQIRDVVGNVVDLTYDETKLVAIEDAIGQVTTISYGDEEHPLRITEVEDPFGRTCSFEYNDDGYLEAITDQLGLRSSFSYRDETTFIEAMTTPYGTTKFDHGQQNTAADLQYIRWAQAEDPMGEVERIEYSHAVSIPNEPSEKVPEGMNLRNENLSYRNTFYWDKKAARESRPQEGVTEWNHDNAVVTHWLHEGVRPWKTSDTPESIKAPLTNRVWFNYPGQAAMLGYDTGSSNKPSAIGQVIEGGETMLQRFEYNSKDLVTLATDPLGRQTKFVYDNDNEGDRLLKVLQVVGGSDKLLAEFEYWTRSTLTRLPIKFKGPSGAETNIEYNDHGQVIKVTDSSGNFIRYYYDMLEEPNVADPEDLDGEEGGGGGGGTVFENDGHGYLREVRNRNGERLLSLNYDEFGRLSGVIDRDLVFVEYEYDDMDRVTKVTYDNDGSEVNIRYDRLDVASVVDRKGRETSYFRNANRQIEAIRDPLNRLTQLEYCKCGALSALTDPEGNVTTWDYDLAGRLTSKLYAPAGGTSKGDRYEYDSDSGRLVKSIDAKGQSANYTYNVDGSIGTVTYKNLGGTIIDPGTTSYTYDEDVPRVVEVTKGEELTSYDYNEFRVANSTTPSTGAGALGSIDGPLTNDTIEFTYDAYDRITTTSINGVAAGVDFDSLGRVVKSNNPLGAVDIDYDGDTGRALSVTNRTFGFVTNLNYVAGPEGAMRLEEIENLGPSSSQLSKFNYEYDINGMITKWTQQAGSGTPSVWTYGYDSAYQLTSAVKSVSGTATDHYAYLYDKMGNRLLEQVNDRVTAGIFNKLNQITGLEAGTKKYLSGKVNNAGASHAGGTLKVDSEDVPVDREGIFGKWVDAGTTYTLEAKDWKPNTSTEEVYVSDVESVDEELITYDDNGNTSGTLGMVYSWDARDQLVTIDYEDGWRTEFSYDAMGRRVRIVEKDDEGEVTQDRKFVWIGYTLAEERSGESGAMVEKRFFGNGEQRNVPEGFDEEEQVFVKYYYTRDHLGSVREVTDAGGVLKARYDYDPYGRRENVFPVGDLEFDFGFTGHLHHHSQLILAPYRVYDPQTGRWISRDLIGEADDLNVYAYASNSPVNYVDLLGLWVHYQVYQGAGSKNCFDFTEELDAIQAALDMYALKNLNMSQRDRFMYNKARSVLALLRKANAECRLMVVPEGDSRWKVTDNTYEISGSGADGRPEVISDTAVKVRERTSRSAAVYSGTRVTRQKSHVTLLGTLIHEGTHELQGHRERLGRYDMLWVGHAESSLPYEDRPSEAEAMDLDDWFSGNAGIR